VPAHVKSAPIDEDTLLQISQLKKSVEDSIENYKFREALKEAMNLARLGNKYLTDTEPWKVIKDDEERVASILHVSIQICASLAIIFEPFMPHTTQKLRYILNMKSSDWEDLGSTSILNPGHKLNEASLLFEKIEDDAIEFQVAKLHNANKTDDNSNSQSQSVTPQKEECTYDEFIKMDIRTATVMEAERVPKTDKLLKLTINTGIDVRTIVSGIAEYYTPEEMVGKQICILANLAPRKIKGIESQGMILMAKEESGNMRIVTPEERLHDGSMIS